MKVINGIDSFCDPGAPVALTLGFFDGVHRGHQKLLHRLIEVAKEHHAIPLVLTFDSHPFRVVCPDRLPPMIMTLTERMKYMDACGVHICVVHPFDKEFAQMSAQDFCENILVKRLRARVIVGGYDTSFGRKREGNSALLRDYAPRFNYAFHEVSPYYLDDAIVSSTRVRMAIMQGNLDEAERCLSRPWYLWAHVIRGHGVGASLGYPTANLDAPYIVMPPHGVYAARVCVQDTWYCGLMYVGSRPTFTPNDSRTVCEVYVTNFSGNLYDTWVRVQPLQFLRGDMTFPSPDQLRDQIARDERTAMSIYRSLPPHLHTESPDMLTRHSQE